VLAMLAALILTGVWSLSAPVVYAVSFTVDSVGDSFVTNWSKDISGLSEGPGHPVAPAGTILSATAIWTVTSYSSSQVNIGVTITNTTSIPVTGHTGHVLSFGFYSSPDATVALLSSGAKFDGISQGGNFPGGFLNIGACIYAANNCSGGNINQGLHEGASDAFILAFTGSNFANGLSVDTFPIKFQGDYGSYEFGANGNGRLPVPPTLILLGAGMLAWALCRRKLA
jgi:hypothetical protein